MRIVIAIILLVVSTSSFSVVKTPISKPWLRLEGDVSQLRFNRQQSKLAFTNNKGSQLSILDIKSGSVLRVSKGTVGASFFWAPDGVRLFYRELRKDAQKTVHSYIRAYDTARLANVAIADFPSITGSISFDPRDLRMSFMSPSGLHTRRLIFPDERLARWQVAQRVDHGKWVSTQNAMLWVTDGGFTMRAAPDDGSGIQSFDISPDGDAVAWATKAGTVYLAKGGADQVQVVGPGQDPRWHPLKPMLVYAAAHLVGDRINDYDIRVHALGGGARYLTTTMGINERWPNWDKDGAGIVFTQSGSTDLFKLQLNPDL